MASSSSRSIIEVPDLGDGSLDHKLQLYQAIRRNDWNNLRELLHKFPAAQTEPITDAEETVLILVAKEGKKSNLILRWLIGIMPNEALTRRNRKGNTALHAAAVVGNVVGARILLSKNPDLANISNNSGHLPFHFAVTHAHRDLVLFLLNVTADNVEPNPFAGRPGAKLICSLIYSRFYDVALLQIQKYPTLAWDPSFSPLKAIAQEPTAFRSGVKFGFWKRLIYTRFLGVKKNSSTPNFMQLNKQDPVFVWRRFFSNVLDIIVPQLKNIRRTKVLHLQAMELLRYLCKEVMSLSSSETSAIINDSFLLAAQYGISEVVEEILKSIPGVINYADKDNHSALHVAVMYRHENVFNVINGQHGESFGFLSTRDVDGNNILHLAGYRAQQNQLDLVSSAVLQMQRELKWFQVINWLLGHKKHVSLCSKVVLYFIEFVKHSDKGSPYVPRVRPASTLIQNALDLIQEVERLVRPEHKKKKNKEGMTPLEVFQKEHKDMEVYEGQWMNGMANSCTVATTIIGTIAFAAATTVPGGNKGDGTPIFSGGAAFIIFAISNALALFSSICTLLIFLSILTSRYATIDYLYSLPNRLIMGLLALFFSITSMIISFSATLYLVFAQNNNRILIPIVALALLPVTLFVMLQFPLLLNMMQSTYGRSILRPPKKEEEPTITQELTKDVDYKWV